MTGLSLKTLTDRFDDESREFALVTSRSLLEGIFTVKRIDLFGSTGESDGDRETVTDGDEAVPRGSLVDLVLMLESGVLGGVSRTERERSERRGDMAG